MRVRRTAGVVLPGLACTAPQPGASVADASMILAQVDSMWTRYEAAALAEDADALAQILTDSAYLVELKDDARTWREDRLIAFPDSTVIRAPSGQ